MRKKCKKFCLPEFIEECSKLNLKVVMLDLARPLSEQGSVDILIHKMTAIYAQALEGNLQALKYAENFESFVEKNTLIPIVDPLPAVHTLLHRPATYALLNEITREDDQMMNPSYVELPDSTLEEKQNILLEANLTFPIVCKPVFGCGGTEAHELAVVMSINRLAEWKGPCVAQSFIPHGAVLYKLYVIGDAWHLVVRPSLKNFRETDAPTVHFNSAHVSKADSCSPLTQLDVRDKMGPIPTPDHSVFDRLVKMIRNSMQMDLFGLDVVISSKTGQYAVIDVNPFPSYDSIENFMPRLAKILRDKIDNSGQSESNFYPSRIVDILKPLDLSASEEERKTRDSYHINIPDLLKSRGYILSHKNSDFSTNGRNIYLINGVDRIHSNGVDSENKRIQKGNMNTRHFSTDIY